MAVNKERLVRQFTDLVKIDSLSFRERDMADALKKIYTDLGIEVHEDDTAAVTGSNAGNLYCYLPASDGTRDLTTTAAHDSWKPEETLVLVGHMDTVAPGEGKKAIIHPDGRITSDGTTVLGADDAAAIAIILEAVREVREEHLPHRNIEILHPTAEEAYTVGSSAFDFSKLRAGTGYCLDCSDRIGSYSAQEPTLIAFRFTVHGKAAHAGFEPEAGVNALAAAAAAIARIPQGRPDDHSTFNFGTIRGGVTTNVIPEEVVVEGELRSAVHEDALKLYDNAAAIFREEAGKIGASFRDEKVIRLTAYRVTEDNPALIRYREALGELGIEPYAKPNFGGSDCNVLVRNGIQAICTFNSMHACHTTREYAVIDELVTMTEIVKKLIRG